MSNVTSLSDRKTKKFLGDFQKQELKFDLKKLKNALNEVLKIKVLDSSLGKPNVNVDESKYTEFVKDIGHTYFKEVVDELKKYYKLGRVRLLLKEPRSTLSWHRDPEPRLHIPIVTNPGCLMVIDKTAQHMPADGSVWVTNNLKYHNAFNGGEENRVHLVACVLDYKFN